MAGDISPYMAFIAVASCLAGIFGAMRFLADSPWFPRPRGIASRQGDIVLLFNGEDLADASPAVEHLFLPGHNHGTDWARMQDVLAPHFPDLANTLSRMADHECLNLPSLTGDMRLTVTSFGHRKRLVLEAEESGGGGSVVDPLIHGAALRELKALRAVTDHLPYLVWQQDLDGTIVWANKAYTSVSEECAGVELAPGGQPVALFSNEAMAQIAREGGVRRQVLARSTENEGWYECRALSTPDSGLFTAVQINAAVQAEQQLREFMQTLTKTFSHLTTGLAIFDRQRRLSLFNPAVTDLTGLPVDFLAARPTLYAVLDRLRDRRMIPEPKNYGAWRKQIAELEAAAVDGTFSDTWALPDGRTYRISGRPHPGGALAFVIEDISAEMSLTRRFRSELELGQAVIDAMDDAIVVFSAAGTISMVNRSYQDFWEDDVGGSVDIPDVTEVSRIWMARTKATPVWGEIRDFVSHERDRMAWEDRVTMVSGATVLVRVVPLSGGSTLVGFRSERLSEEPGYPHGASISRSA